MKLEIGDLVYIKKDLPDSMSHFENDCYALITDVDKNEYMTTISGWYPIKCLKLIRKNSNNNLLKKLENNQ